ncbi:MAG: cyclic nucleotide-binding domain-containing protein [Acidobacteriota bacterium]
MKKVLYILGKLEDEDVDWLVANGERRSLSAGEVLIQEGKAVEHVHVVVEGSLEAVLGDGTVLSTLGAGEVVGELSFLDSRPPAATVRAAADARVLAVPRDLLATKLESDVPFSARFYRALGTFLAARLRSTVAAMGYGSAPGSEYEDPEELDPDLLDEVSLAASRFDWLLRRLRGD